MTDWLGPEALDALRLSLLVATVAVVLMLPFALGIATLLARPDLPGRSLIDALVHLPLVAPPVVTGYVLLVLFGRNGSIGAFLQDWFGITVAFRWTGAVLAAAVMAFPLMVRAIRLSIEAVDPRLFAAAHSLGAGPVRTWFTITLPLAMPGILAGTVLSFAKALGEFGATITFVSNIPGETRTLPLAIFTFLQVPGGEPEAVRLVLVAVAISLAALLVSEWLAGRMRRRRMG